MDGVKRRATAKGQGQLFVHWEELQTSEKEELAKDVEVLPSLDAKTGVLTFLWQRLDFDELNRVFCHSVASERRGNGDGELLPVENVFRRKDMTEATVFRLSSIGRELIAQGKVAVVIMAGGQGTRLGSVRPKGCYDVGLPSHKSLFQLHCERILRIGQMVGAKAAHSSMPSVPPLYIMTSLHTHDATVAFFEEQNFFGLDSTRVHFFQQGVMPCFSQEGKVLLETKSRVAVSPNGNGGIYAALRDAECLDEMQRSGVECIDCFSIDNLLAKAADPLFIGYCWESRLPCGARVVAKSSPEEKVGVFARREGCTEVVEYSEISSEMACAREADSHQLRFNWGNICMHFFTTKFLATAADLSLPCHIARKTVQSCGTAVQGLKLERFVFDVFPMADGVALMEVERAEQHAPVKNASGARTDSPDTARRAMMNLHRRQRWVEAAGGSVEGDGGVEVSPLLSYEGEDLEERCRGKSFLPDTALEAKGPNKLDT